MIIKVEVGSLIPSFDIRLKLINPSKPQSLEQRIVFKGVQEDYHDQDGTKTTRYVHSILHT